MTIEFTGRSRPSGPGARFGIRNVSAAIASGRVTGRAAKGDGGHDGLLGVADDVVIVAVEARCGIARKRPPRSHGGGGRRAIGRRHRA
jgi:hypothetical protein